MFKGLLSRLMVGAMIGVVAIAAVVAEAQVGRPGYPGGGSRRGPPGGRTEDVTMTIGRQFNGFSRIDIDQVMGIATRGREIQALSVVMWAPGGRSQATLLEGGGPSGETVLIAPHRSLYHFQVRSFRGRLELQLNGPVYVESMTARVSDSMAPQPPWPPRPVTLTQAVHQTFQSGGLDVTRLVNLYQYQGMRVTRVLLRGTSARGLGQAELQINRMAQGQVTVGTWSQEYSFYPYGLARIGYEIQDMAFLFRGNINVETVTVELQP